MDTNTEVKDQIVAALPALDSRHAWKARTEVRMLRFVKSIGFKVKRYYQYVKGETPLVSKRVEFSEVVLDHPGTTFRGTFVPEQPADRASRQVKRAAARAIRFHNISRIAPALSRRDRRAIARGEQI